MKFLEAILLVVAIIVFGLGLSLLWTNFPTKTTIYEPYSAQISPNTPEKSIQFYPNMRFRDKRISYSIEPACTDVKRKDIRSALSIISANTNIIFYESPEKHEISYLCSEVAPDPDQKGHFVAGEGGPTEIINSSVYSVILSSKISLYRSESCDHPQIALHETLHALGFDHNSNRSSIMYPITECDQQLDKYIVEEIDRLYSVESRPDLLIDYANATRNGRYLNFNITVANFGLQDVTNSSLDVEVDNELVKEYNLGPIDIGTKRILDVENLRVSVNSKAIALIVKPTPEVPEISLTNNRIDLIAQSS